MEQPLEVKNICDVCHQPILPTYYFCPNCGTKINSAPLSTSIATQFGLYIFSAILPFIGFLLISKWSGLKYFRSKDPKAKIIGLVAWGVLVFSTVVLCWLVYVETQNVIQAINSSLNSLDLSIYGL